MSVFSLFFMLHDGRGESCMRLMEIECSDEGRPLQLWIDGDPIPATMAPLDVAAKLAGTARITREVSSIKSMLESPDACEEHKSQTEYELLRKASS